MKILLTRPYQDSIRLKNIIEELTPHKCHIYPLLEMEYLNAPVNLPDNATIAITSLNGIEALAKNASQRGLRIIAVGNESAARASELGFKNVESSVDEANPDANEINLVNYITKNIPISETIYHVSGSITKGGLKAALAKTGHDYHQLILYNANSVRFSTEFISEIKSGNLNAYSFFSPRTANIFTDQIKAADLASYLKNTSAFCFSQNIAHCLSNIGFANIYIPQVTSTENFVNLLMNHK